MKSLTLTLVALLALANVASATGSNKSEATGTEAAVIIAEEGTEAGKTEKASDKQGEKKEEATK
jgi:basic membrane lipoprotein Med (substrate-binding protein (PBP1-ABC) superfamily)